MNGRNCHPCASQCKACTSSASQCTGCKNGELTYKGQCVAQCPSKTLHIDDYCVDCDSSCDGCSTNPFNCLACKQGFFHLTGRCISRCPDGYYTDYQNQSCKKCDANCKMCSGPGNCQLCTDSSLSVANQCDNECGPNCLTCEDYDCKLCAEGTVWTGILCLSFCPSGSKPVNGVCVCDFGYIYDNKCLPICPAGTIPKNGRCIECDSSCSQCLNEINFCTGCSSQDQVLDPVSGRC